MSADAAAASDGPRPDAAAPTFDPTTAEEQRQLDDALGRLFGEHQQDFRPAMAWLIEHPDLARPPLIAIVEGEDDPANMARARAALVLGEISHPDDVPLLAQGLRGRSETGRWDFAEALAKHRDPAAFDALVAATGSEDAEVAAVAAVGLGWRKDEAARPVLEALLDHASASVRYQAVGALTDLGAAKSRDALLKRKKVEKDAEVRGAIRKALAS